MPSLPSPPPAFSVLLSGVLALTACTAAAPKDNADVRSMTSIASPEAMTLGPGDRLVVRVLGHAEISSSADGVLVDPEGNLFLPVVGRVNVLARTLTTLNDELTNSYAAYMHDPDVTATVLEYGARYFHVLGKVSLPGRKELAQPFNALEAVAQGGALRPGADRASVFLLRPHGETLEVHLFNVETPGPEGLVRIMPGDIVFVRQKGTQDLKEDLLPIIAAFGFNAFAFAAWDSND